MIQEQAARADTLILCAEPGGGECSGASSGGDDDCAVDIDGNGNDSGSGGSSTAGGGQRRKLLGVVVCQFRLDGTAMLSGLRVCPAARGRGVGAALMRAAAAAAAPRAPAGLVGTTAPALEASVRIFRGLGWPLTATVEAWPPYHYLEDYQKAIGWPDVRARRELHGSVVDLVPGAPAALERARSVGAGAGAAWRRCRSQRELAAAVAGVRRRQAAWWRARRDEQYGAGSDESSSGGSSGSDDGDSVPASMAWVPWVYDVIGASSGEALELLEQYGGSGGDDEDGDADGGGFERQPFGFWLLSLPPDAGGDDGSAAAAANAAASDAAAAAVDAVLLVAPSEKFRRAAAGVLSARPAAVAPCLARAAAAAPHFVAFVDRGLAYFGSPNEGDLDLGARPQIYSETAAPESNYYVFASGAAPRP